MSLNSTITDNKLDELGSCHLVGAFSIFIQTLVGTLGFSTLIIKRYFESPRRTWLVWSFDVSKQMISGGLMHGTNLLVSYFSGKSEHTTNPCSWYILNLTMDCTLGILFVTGYLRLFGYLARRMGVKGLESGDYGRPPSWRRWMKQAGLFCASMSCMKMSVVALIELCPFLVVIGDWVLKPVLMTHSPRFEIVFVMAIWPLLLNIFESWVLDQFIKRKHHSHNPVPTTEEEEEDEDEDRISSYEMQNTLSSASTAFDASHLVSNTRISLDIAELLNDEESK